MLRRGLPFLVAFVALAAWLSPLSPSTGKAVALPVASSDTSYGVYGRVFPDPQGCTKGTPASSPWAKGNVCATTFLTWDETINGLKYLQSKFPRFGQLVDLHDLKATVPEFATLDMQSAGLTNADLTRNRKDLYVFVVTDRDSKVPLADKKHFAYSLSIHGIERAGLEGGVRAAEDLVTWAATAPSTRILEPTKTGPTAGDVLTNDVMYFVLSNPDGWSRGDVDKGGVYFTRYNGDGVDLNREFPGNGYDNPEFTSLVEPEAQGYAAYLKRERALAHNAPFAGSLDLHGMIQAPAFSFSLLPGGARDYATNARVVQQAQAVYADATKRLSWSPLIAAPDKCPGPIPVFIPIVAGQGALPMCADQWGTTWDTIDYEATGTFGDWMATPVGLDAPGLDNEMAYSHIAPNNAFVPALEQLHVDGNKGLIYAQLAALSTPAPAPALNVSAAYAPAAHRLVRKASIPAARAALPSQQAITTTEVLGSGFEFDVKGPGAGVQNGGMSAELSFANVDGISVDSLSALTSGMALERFGPTHPGDTNDWHEVAHYYLSQTDYLGAGARIDLNDPLPGHYRLRPANLQRTVASVKISFIRAQVIPTPNAPYDVANTDVFKGIPSVRAITPAMILADPKTLDGVHAYVLADDPAPGVASVDRARWYAALKSFVERGGDLVLTDHAIDALDPLGIVPTKALRKGVHYGGWLSFTDGSGASTFGKTPLTKGLDLPGAANGSGMGLGLARQTYDPAAVGYIVADAGIGDCSGGPCDAPQEIVDPAAWTKAGGVIAGRSGVLGPVSPSTGSAPTVFGVGYGEVPMGLGHVRIAGGLLPTPTEANNHPYGLEAQGLSWTGYQILVNMMSGAAPSSVLGVSIIPRTGGTSRVPLDAAAVVITFAALVRFGRARRRLHPLP